MAGKSHFIADSFQDLHGIAAARKVNRGSSAGETREKTSTIVSSRSFCLSRRELIMDEVHGPDLVGARGRPAISLTRRFGAWLRSCRPNSR